MTRQTKYTKAVTAHMRKLGHATNMQLLESMRTSYPELSATTIHRITTRFLQQGLIHHAPPDKDGSMRFDTNLSPHDHFVCTACGGIRDIDVADEITPLVSNALGGCKITGRLLIHGSCKSCISKNNNEKG